MLPVWKPIGMDETTTSGRILFVSQWLGGGGIERNLVTLSEALRRRGREVGVAAWQIQPEISGRPNPFLNRLRAAGVEIHPLREGRRLNLPNLARQLAALARRRNYPVLVAKELTASLTSIMAKILLAGRPRVTVEFHNTSDIHERTGLSRTHRRLGERLLPRADALVAVSEATRRDAARFFRLPEARIAVIPNPLEETTSEACGATDPEPAFDSNPPFVCCARLQPMKGIEILLSALARVRGRHDARLVILGEGPLRADLMRQAEELNIAAAVRWEGQVARPATYFRRARAVVSASVFGEAWGLALAEAMACGAPVIATRCGGVVELLGHGAYGELVEPGSAEALAAAMARLWDDQETPRQRARQAQTWVERFSPHRIVPELEAIYWPGAGPIPRSVRQQAEEAQRAAA